MFKKKVTPLKTATQKAAPKPIKAPVRDALRGVLKSPGGPTQAQKTSVPAKRLRLPRFGKTQLLAFVRDLKCLFVFWEVTPQTAGEAERELGGDYAGSSIFLRMFKKKRDGTSGFLGEMEVQPGDMNCYMNLEEGGGSYFLEISRKTRAGRYLVLARSNEVQTGAPGAGAPPADPSWKMPVEIREYFNEEAIGQSFEPGKKLFSADLGGQAALHRRRLGPQDRHAASNF